MERIAQHSEQIKHAVDAVTIPAGIVAGLSHWMGLINGVMTFLVLLTSLIWGVYRIMDMREKRNSRKDEDV